VDPGCTPFQIGVSLHGSSAWQVLILKVFIERERSQFPKGAMMNEMAADVYAEVAFGHVSICPLPISVFHA